MTGRIEILRAIDRHHQPGTRGHVESRHFERLAVHSVVHLADRRADGGRRESQGDVAIFFMEERDEGGVGIDAQLALRSVSLVAAPELDVFVENDESAGGFFRLPRTRRQGDQRQRQPEAQAHAVRSPALPHSTPCPDTLDPLARSLE